MFSKSIYDIQNRKNKLVFFREKHSFYIYIADEHYADSSLIGNFRKWNRDTNKFLLVELVIFYGIQKWQLKKVNATRWKVNKKD